MTTPLILASGSETRAQLLRNANVSFTISKALIDEKTIKDALMRDGVSPRDIADALAEAKARKVSNKNPGSLVLGCDQVLDFSGDLLSKPENKDHARTQLLSLRGTGHSLYSAAVLYRDGQPIWRHIGHVRLKMRDFSIDYLDEYLERNWDSIQHSVGGYKLEEEGIRLFSGIEGDYFYVLGLPLLELLGFLMVRGDLEQ